MSLEVVDQRDSLHDDSEEVVVLAFGDSGDDFLGNVESFLKNHNALRIDVEGVLSVEESHVDDGVNLAAAGELGVGADHQGGDEHAKDEGSHDKYYYYRSLNGVLGFYKKSSFLM